MNKYPSYLKDEPKPLVIKFDYRPFIVVSYLVVFAGFYHWNC